MCSADNPNKWRWNPQSIFLSGDLLIMRPIASESHWPKSAVLVECGKLLPANLEMRRYSDSYSTWDTLSFWAVNLSSAFLLSASHNVLYFVLDIRTPVIHFLHNFTTFILLLICQLASNPKTYGRLEDNKASQSQRWVRVLLPPAILQLISTSLSSRIHSQNRSGSLYLLR